jgi:hypothetical protein
MEYERRSWEEDSAVMAEVKRDGAPGAAAAGPLAEKASQESTLAEEESAQKKTSPDVGEETSRPVEGTT